MALKKILFLSLVLTACISSMGETKIHLPLHNAILQENISLLDQHLQNPDFDVNETDVYDNTALHVAASKLDTKSITLLLKHGAIVQKNNAQKTPTSLFLNALIARGSNASKDESDCLKKLICKTPNINEKNPENGTTLAHRILANKLLFADMIDLVKILDVAGADWNCINAHGNTPLHSFLIMAHPLLLNLEEWIDWQDPIDTKAQITKDVIKILSKKTVDRRNVAGKTIRELQDDLGVPHAY